jgi:sarcosine oxidase, subunit gamma
MAEVQCIEVPFLTKLNLRLHAGGAAAAAVGEVLSAPLPVEPNTVASGGACRVLWLGPDEWLVVAPPADRRRLEEELRAALGAESGAVVDVSGERTILQLSGPRAREVLMKGCSIDLHPTAFAVGRCAQTGLARAQVVLVPTREDAFWIFVRSSFSDYLSAWLGDAMAEYL